MKYLTEDEKEKAFTEAKTKACHDEELTEEEQDILYERLQAHEKEMSRYSDGGPAPPPWIYKLTKYYTTEIINLEDRKLSEDFLKKAYEKYLEDYYA